MWSRQSSGTPQELPQSADSRFARCTTSGASIALFGSTPTRSPTCFSPLEARRAEDTPELPEVLRRPDLQLEAEGHDFGGPVAPGLAEAFPGVANLRARCIVAADSQAQLDDVQPLTVGLVSVSNNLAAAGTHNVILGLSTFLSQPRRLGSRLWGIRSLTKGDEVDINLDEYCNYMNQAGSDLLPTTPLSFVTERLVGQVGKLCDRLALDGLVFLCGPSEMVEVTKLAEQLRACGTRAVVSAVLHSLSGWVRLPGWLSANLGFDSACGILAEVAGNIALSRQPLDRDIYHFVACGSPPVTLEVAMQIHPTLCFIGVDVAQRGLTLQQIIDEICDLIVQRHHQHGLHSGVVMVSDDFFDQLVEMQRLQKAIHKLRLEKPAEMRSEEAALQLLPPDLGSFFNMLPADVRSALVFRTGINGLPLLKPQEAERELGSLVARCLAARGRCGHRTVTNFMQQPHSLRHLGWCPMPTALDCTLGYALGHIAGVLTQCQAHGYVASVRDLSGPPAKWTPCAVPMVRLLDLAPDNGGPTALRWRLTPADPVCALWHRVRDRWRYQQSYRQPGPVQYWGPGGKRPLEWTTYTLRAAHTNLAELLEEVEVDGGPPKTFLVPLGRPFQLVRRTEAIFSPLQKWRCTYQPVLPLVLRNRFRIVEEDRKGRICADDGLVHAAFENLWRTDNLKGVKIQPMPDEVSVLQMLPERPVGPGPMPRDASWAQLGYVDSGTWERSPSEMRSPSEIGHHVGARGDIDSDSMTSFCMYEHSGIAMDFKSRLRAVESRVGIAILGKPGPGLNNVIQGLFDYLNLPERRMPGALICIAMGIAGLKAGVAFELDAEALAPHRNQGGCDLLGQSEPQDLQLREEDFEACAKTVRDLRLDGLIIWGGRNVHSWTARLAEFFAEQQLPTRVVAVPASTQSDLPLVEQTLGYDTVCKLYASIVGNLATQAASSGKLWCFARIPGRSISQIAAEVALETHPHVVLMAGDLEQQQLGLPEVTQMICNVIDARSREGKHYGVVLIPDQFLASVREMRQLFESISQILKARPEAGGAGASHDFAALLALLPPLSRALFKSFPERAKAQIVSVIHEGAQGVVDLCTVDTEMIFQALVEAELTRRVVLGTYKGTFRAITYSLPYHGRAAMPTNFDCDLGYTVGFTAGIFVDAHRTGMLVDVRGLKEDVQDWEVGGTPLASLLTFQDEPLPGWANRGFSYRIEPKTRLYYDVGLEQGTGMPEPADRTLVSPGPAQFEGPCAGLKTQTLCMPQLQRVRQMAKTEQLIRELKAKASAGCPPEVLEAVKMLLQGGVEFLRQL